MASSVPQRKNKRFILLVVIPLIACILSSIIGIILGQVGNLLFAVLGDVPNFLTFLIFFGLFLVTFGLSFLISWLLKKWLVGPKKASG
jgi:uncharacterized membrane protein